ncbi:hypothetical protein R3J22_09435 [Trueperella bernardiae]|uniref:hypothetical protein n=1 Tax=Trueperella bernardiae TaxID=59561 RepID=UPI00294A6FCF|nr:hypothetical protein [Trueperella bernardiae]MDV6239740.1 hypothetical protein [Trueperella bernardiae]
MNVIFMIFSIGGAFMSGWFAYQAVIEGSPDTSARRFPPHHPENVTDDMERTQE